MGLRDDYVRCAVLAVLLLLPPAVASAQANCAGAGSGVKMPFSSYLGPTAQSGVFRLTFPVAGCNWSVSSNSSALTFTGARSGTATGTSVDITVKMAANTTAEPRKAELTYSGGVFNNSKYSFLQNSNNCAYYISPASVSLSAGSATGTFALSVLPSTCWGQFEDVPDWITLSASNFTTDTAFVGPDTIGYRVRANAGKIRQAKLTFYPAPPSTSSFTIQQAGNTSGITITPDTLPDAIKGAVYLQALVAIGGTPPYIWTAKGLPAGLTLNSATGILSGTPTTSGSSTVTVTAAESSASTNFTASRTYTLTVANLSNCIVTGSSTPSGWTDPWSRSLTIVLRLSSGGCPWSISSNSNALSFPNGTSGTTTASTLEIPVVVSANDTDQPRTMAFTYSAGNIRDWDYTVIQNSSNCAYAISPVSSTLPAAGGSGSFNLAVSPAGCWGRLVDIPAWATLSSPVIKGYFESTAGFIGGGDVNYSAAYNAGAIRQAKISLHPGLSSPATFTLQQAGNTPGIGISPDSLPGAAVGIEFSQTLTALGGTAPYTYAAAGLPAGLSLNSATGVLSGTPSTAGNFPVTITASDSSTPTKLTASRAYNLTVSATSACSALYIRHPSGWFTAEGGALAVTLRFTSMGCAWSITSDSLAISFPNGTSGTTEATTLEIPMVLAANTTGKSRTIGFTYSAGNISKQEFKVLQNPANCTFAFVPESIAIPAAGGSGSFNLAVSPADCWGYWGNVPDWAQLSSSALKATNTFIGPGTVNYTATPNPGVIRQAQIWLAYSTSVVTIQQTGSTPGIAIAKPSLPTGTVGVPYAQPLVAVGGVQPYSWTVTGLPPGLSLNSVTGSVSGTPTTPGEFTASFKVSDSTLPDKYSASVDVTMSIAPATRSITSVRTASDFGNGETFASGSWIEVKGALLAATTRTWTNADFTGANAPTGLDGVGVTVNGKPAFVYYVSPTQINIQAPDDPATGTVLVVVSGPSGTTSKSAQKQNLAPGMLAPASFNIGRRQFLCAHFNDGVYVGREGLIAGVAFRPAKPGDAIVAYGTGFGEVVPASPAGITVSQSNTLANPVSVRFGETAASVLYQGLSPGAIGLYQFNIAVPDVADGDYPVEVAVAGVKVPQTLYLTVGKSPYIAWNFYSTTEGWTPVNTTSSEITGGIWTVTPGDDPHLVGPEISVPARDFKYVQVRMKSQCSGPASIYFKTAANDVWAEARRVNFDPAAALSGFAELSVPVGNHAEWTSDATITGIRLDPCDSGLTSDKSFVQVDYIRLTPAP